ncbi:SAM-dependent methyltransferase [Paraburkholderia ginsengiterrae]|uniref:SAM-dependent methyltransferase n=1 Tax=Paraburkholderia ginsengiterrae TaxID=1462993 RepID=A0A1A9MYX8_9BURK|nr:class I SAM-dependent methyltransferase [Paraburkholderia ginsengiterrae]OAJ52089.1 SAM-dependent methyltransferase [Paraburkholderia ginsengiterrae]OAJ63453.1 SAM-dependent methyltransferase [Paraburkholderia ginsengiterrae]
MDDISPEAFIDAISGYQKTAAIKAAVALDLFTAIQNEDGELSRIARRVEASERGVRILCDYLTVLGFLQKETEYYRLTPSTSVFLTSSSPAAMGSIVDFFAAPEMMALWLDDPVVFVRKGGSIGLGNMAPDHPVWLKFARAMVPFVAPTAQNIAQQVGGWPQAPKRVLDIAAGHGLFGIAIAKAVPGAEIVATDWQAVLEIAKENAAASGVSARHHTIAGSAFEVDWGKDFDLVLITNFLHHFDRPTCVEMLSKVRRSLSPGGQVLAVDFVPNDDRVSPPFAAAFSFVMLASTPQGDAYTAREFEEMGREAGFSTVSVAPLPPSPQSLITFK